MNHRTLTRILTILLLALLALDAAADQAEKPPQGQGRYLVVLWHPGTPVPGKEQDRMRTVQEPNVAALGGRVVASHANRRVVFLPHAAAKELRRHEAVSYVQRIWTGEPFSEWKQAAATSSDAAASRPQRIASDSDQFTWSKDYSYNADGNITHIGTSSSGFDEFAYDGVGRLTEAVVNGAPETYSYDAFGNLTGFARPTGGRSIPVDPATNRLVGVNHDAAGNITNRTGREGYAYDPLNMMVVQYESTPGGDRRILYDANDERIGSTYGASSQRWTIRDFNGQILREFTSLELALYADWHWEQDHIRGEGQLIAGDSQVWHYNPEPASPILWGGERHYHLDHLGSVRIVTNEDGKALAEHDFFPFGATRTKQHQEQLNAANYHTDGMRFAGHWRDFMGNPNVENDDYLDYMHARYYDPHLGRFLSVDPGKDWNQKQPQSWNLYTYVRNNPINATDPDGRQIAQALSNAYQEAAEKLKPVSDVAAAIAPLSGAAAITNVAVKTLGLGTQTGTALGSGASSSNVAIAASKEVGIASEFALLVAGTASPISSATSTTRLYRAVDGVEAADIAATNSFRPAPNGTEFKGFFFNKSDAQSLAQQMTKLTGDSYGVVGATAPRSIVSTSPPHSAALEGPGVLIPNSLLSRIIAK